MHDAAIHVCYPPVCICHLPTVFLTVFSPFGQVRTLVPGQWALEVLRNASAEVPDEGSQEVATMHVNIPFGAANNLLGRQLDCGVFP